MYSGELFPVHPAFGVLPMLHPTRASALALLCVLGPAVPAPAEDPQLPTAILDRIGRLPGDLIKAKKTDAEITDALFLAALTRLPTEDEKEKAVKHLAGARDRKTACVDLAWALVNTKEFMKLHGLDKDITAAIRLLNTATADWGKEEKKEKNEK
jgi:hypothetical protein